MIQCIKTGCLVWLEEYHEWAYGDAFEGYHFFVFRLCDRRHTPFPGLPNKHFDVIKIAHWWDDEKTSMKTNSTLITYAHWAKNWGYEGKPI